MRKRAKERGAVLAEASFALTTLVVFLGGINFIHNALAAKIEVQQEARESAFQRATRHCSSGANDNLVGVDLPMDGLDGDAADVLGTVIQLASPITYDAAHGHASRTVSGSMAAYQPGASTMTKNPLSITVTGDSYVMCTPEPRDGNLQLVQWGVEFMTRKITQYANVATTLIETVFNWVKDKVLDKLNPF